MSINTNIVESFTAIDLLENLAEALRQARRNYVKPLDLSSVIIDLEDESLMVTIYDPVLNKDRKFCLELSEEINGDIIEQELKINTTTIPGGDA